jgi:amino acid adenylation domain-containing protein
MARITGHKGGRVSEELRQPLTRAQLALWLVQETQPGIAVNVAQYMDLRGPLDRELFMSTGVELGHWQQMLFTRYEHTADGPMMVIDHSMREEALFFDLRTDPNAVASAMKWMQDDYTRPTDPTKDRAAEAVLFQIADDRHLFYERGHHLSWDGASATSLRNKHAARYTALQQGTAQSLPPRPDLSVPDRADNDYRASRRFQTDKEYWLNELAGLDAATVLAPRPGPPDPVSHRITGAVPLTTSDRIKAVESTRRTTLPGVVTAAIAAYVARVRGIDDITLSLPVAARTTAALRDTPLPVSNVLPLRTRVGPNTTVGDALATTQAALIGALRHQRYRFEDVRLDTATHRPNGSVLNLAGYGGPPINLMLFDRTMNFGECTGTFHVLTTGPVEDIAFSLYYSGAVAPENLRFDIQANPNRYTLAEVEDIHQQLLSMIETFVDVLETQPDSLINSLPLADMVNARSLTRRSHSDDSSLEFWRRTLADAPHRPTWPTNGVRGARAPTRSEAVLAVDATGSAELRQQALLHNVTVFDWLHSAVAATVSLYTSADDILVAASGVPDQPTPDAVMGTEPIFLRLHVSQRSTLATLADQSARYRHAAQPHVSASLRDVAAALDAETTSSETPLTDILVTYFDGEPATAEAAHSSEPNSPEWGMHWAFSHVGGGLEVRLTYREDLISPDIADGVLHTLTEIIAQSIDAPHEPVAAPSHGKEQYTTSSPSGSQWQSVVDQVLAMAHRYPEQPAVLTESATVDFRELADRAKALAAELRRQGVGRGSRVAVAVPRSELTLIAQLSVLLTGAAFVPVDPDYPAARVKLILDDSAPALLLVTEMTSIDDSVIPQLRVDRDYPQTEWTPPAIDAQDLAYIIYTSGSTGRPKGVAVEHGSFSAMLDACAEIYGPRPGDIFSCTHSTAFDFSIFEMFTPWAAGAAVLLADTETVRDPQRLWQALIRHHVTVLSQTPSAFAPLAEVAADAGEIGALRDIVFGGEALRPGTVNTWFDAFGEQVTLTNMYGLTEATVHVTAARVDPADQRSLIGQPIRGLHIDVLDRWLRATPVGVWGELYVTGRQVAQSYWDNPALTAARFVACPGGQRMYRTGDIVRRTHDGSIEYRGRSDDQVQIRGFRIELDEVAAVLRAAPGVSDAVVIVRDAARTGGGELAGYLRGTDVDVDAVRSWCTATLPAFQVPAHLTVLAEFPLTASGKVDTAALPGVERKQVAQTGDIDPVLSIVIEAVAGELGVDPRTVDPEAGVFETGVNSLGAMNISLVLGRRTGHPVSVRSLVEASSLNDVADQLRLASSSAPSPDRRISIRGDTIDRVPLTPQQEALWLRWQLDPTDTSYNLAAAIRVEADLADKLPSAIHWVVDRHAALRTTYPYDDNGPYQRVHDPGAVEFATNPIPVDDLAAALGQLDGPFDLASEMAWRSRIFDVDNELWLGVVLHHIAVDGRSVQIIQSDVARYLAGDVHSDADVIDYPDYALWLRESDDGDESQLDEFWKTVFAEPPSPLQLPGVNRGAHRHHTAEGVTASIGAHQYRLLTEFAAASQTTAFIAVHAALAVVLSRQSGNSDIVVGTATSGRTSPELTDVVGMFARTIPLRTRIDLDMSFSALITEITGSDLDAFSHSGLSPTQLAHITDPHRDATDAQLFDVFLADIDAGTVPSGAYVPPPHARFGLDFSLVHHSSGEGLDLRLHYAEGMIDTGRAQSLVRSVVELLEQALAAPERPVVTHLLGSAEQGLTQPAPAVATMYELMSESMTRFANSVAVDDKESGVSLRYRDLDAASTSLARILIEHGAGPGAVVAILVGRSVGSIVAMLAVIKTGAAFVQLNPNDPPARNALITQIAHAALGIRSPGMRFEENGTSWVNLDPQFTSLDATQQFSVGERTRVASVDDVAYVTFTSGTTGTPKGVMIPHRGIAPFAHDVVDRVGLRADSRVLHNYNVTFDAHLIELIPTLVAGATIVICPPDVVAGAELRDLLIDRSITVFYSTPSVLATISATTVPELESVVVGGEALPHNLAEEWATRTRLVNFYGPTEATVAATGDAPVDPTTPITIGVALSGVSTLILDSRMRPVPPNTVGELYLASLGLARGYVGDSVATAHRFVANPYSVPGARMYRTGDLVHRRDDGRIVIQGRADEQIKLRGIRLEPAEINAALSAVPGVRGVFTGVVDTPAGEQILASWLTAESPDELDLDHVRAQLFETLPRRVVPSSLTVIEEFPVTPNGKVDRRALPDPWTGHGSVEAPGTPTELMIAKVYADVVGIDVESIGVHSDFFELGGTSLSATRAASRLTEHTGRTVTVRHVFEARTVSTLAALIDGLDPTDDVIVPVHHHNTADLPLSYSQRRMWILNRLDPDSTAYTVPVVLRIKGSLDVDALLSAVTELGRRHESLRTVYPETPSGPYQRVLAPDTVKPPAVKRISVEQITELESVLVTAPFDLTASPAFRAELVEIAGGDEWLLVLVMHHVAIDGWSMRTLLTDLVQIYQHGPGRAAPTELTYGDYTLWQLEWLGDADNPASRYHRQLDYWRATLNGAAAPIALPPAAAGRAGGRYQAVIDDNVVGDLAALAVQESATVFHVAHAALAVLMSYATGRDDLIIGSPVLGRSHPAWEPIVGMFVNTIALRTHTDSSATVRHTVRAVRDVDLSAADHGDVPYDAIARAVRPEHHGAADPLISVLLVEQDYASMLDPGLHLDVPGVDIELLGRPDALVGAKFDLEVVLAHRPGQPFTVTMIYSEEIDGDHVAGLLQAYVGMLRAAATAADQAFPVPDITRSKLLMPDLVAAPNRARSTDHNLALEVAGAMASTLGLPAESVRLGDDFFALGGTSLSATQVTAVLSQRLGRTVPVRLLFEASSPLALAAELDDSAADSVVLPPLTGPDAVPVPNPVPLAPTQRRLWVVQRLAPETSMYLIPILVPVPEGLSDADVTAAVQHVVDRHAPLRTSYPNSPSGPVQRVHSRYDVEIHQIRMEDTNAEEVVREQLSAGFDLETEPPIRWSLISDSSGNRAVLAIAHHIAVDGTSVRILSDDLARAFDGHRRQPLKVDYPQVTAWQLAAQERVGDKQQAFWTGQLAGYSGLIDIAADRPAVRTTATASFALDIGAVTTGQVAAVSARLGVTEFHVVHAALALALSIQAGTDDIAIGTPGSLRQHVETSDMVGMFVSTLALRTVIRPGMTTDELLQLVRRTDLDALDNALVPFDDVVTLVDPPRDPGRHPLVQVALSYLADSTAVAAMGSGATEAVGSPDSEFDLQLTVGRSSDGLHAIFTYAADLFDTAAVDKIARRWLMALESIATPAPMSLDRLDLRVGDERRAVGEPKVVCHRTLDDIFAATVESHGPAIAIDHPSGSMTYHELDAWTSRIAQDLRKGGVARGNRVAVIVPRSVQSVAMFWGTVKAGAVYVPIDPHYPPERIERMLQLADADHVVRNDDVLPYETSNIGNQTQTPHNVPTSPDDVVAILFTSGTLGQPNAVALTHRGMEKFTDGSVFDIVEDDRVAHAASISFDASIFEMLLAVGPGATLSVIDPDVSGGPGATRELAARRATWMFATPSVLATLDEAQVPDLRAIVIGGEACTPDLVRRWAPGRALFNGYGPTETTMCVTVYPLAPGRPILIGDSLDDVVTEIFDTHLRPVPDGVAGELYLTGPAVAQGYFGNPALTAVRFVAGHDGRRWYRTGDLVRRRIEGLQYLGRIDHQVKIRGQRIEPGEIDIALVTAGAERAATVVIERPTGSVLVSYVVGVADDDVKPLRAFCAATLPSAMIPARIVVVGELPRTAAGKLDTSRLPAPDWDAQVGGHPETELEHAIVEAFREHLGTNAVGVDDDFFVSGGDSLLATRVAATLEDQLGRRVPVRTFFEQPTPRGLAQLLDILPRENRRQLPALGSVPDDGDIPLAPNQRRLWYIHEMLAGSSIYTVPIYVPVPADVDSAAVVPAIDALVRRHAPLRTSYPDSPTGPRQLVHDTFRPRLWHVTDDGRDARLAFDEISAPFDLQSEPPVRVVVLDHSESRGVLFVVHHIAADGDSAQIVATDFTALLQGRELRPLLVDFPQVARWQTAVNVLVREQHLKFWTHTLAGYSGVLDLVPDRPRTRSLATASVTTDVDSEVVERIPVLSDRLSVTEFHVVHAALALALSIQTGTDDVAVGTPASMRRHADVADMVGMFVSTVVLRTELRTGMTSHDLVVAVRDADVAALDNAFVPFDDVVAELAPPRDPGRHPLVQVALSFATGQSASLAGLPSPDSEFDLQITAVRQAGGLGLTFTYSTALFTTAQIASFASIVHSSLDAVTALQPTSLDRFDIRTPEERHSEDIVLKTSTRTLGDIFESAVLANPSGVAVRDGVRALTYRELDDWAAAAAGTLTATGVRPGDCVAMMIQRSMESVVALWAIVRVGATYVPIDPGYPSARIERMLEISRVTTVLTINSLVPQPSGQVAPVEYSRVSPDAPAFLLFTSGTTGTPNGVSVTHRGLSKFTDGTVVDIGPSDRVAHATSISFDASLFEILLAAGPGATLEILGAESVGGQSATDQLAERGVTWMFTTPTILATLDERRLGGVRGIVVGGEPLPADLALRWEPKRQLLNGYGPTETTMCVTLFECVAGAPVLIGSPLDDVTALVLDTHLRPVPAGVAGELYLGGPALAQGYWRDPALTASRFIADGDGGRLYRTGDLVRLTPLGFEYLGRIDRQVKIRGQRIELAEIDSVLVNAGAHQAVTVVAGDPDRPRLVSYVVAAHDQAIIDHLTERCAQLLPHHMIPSAIMTVDSLPRTSSGKLDTAALPQPVWQAVVGGEARTATEKTVLDIFRDVLGRNDIGIHDSFFDAGGNSLLLLDIARHISDRLGVPAPVATLFEHPSPATLAAAIDSARDLSGSLGQIVPLSGAEAVADAPIWCIHPGSGLAADYRAFAQAVEPLAVFGLQMPGLADPNAPTVSSIEELAASHVDALLTMQPEGPYRLLGWSLGGVVAHEMAGQLARRGKETEVLILLDVNPIVDESSETVEAAIALDPELAAGLRRIDPVLFDDYQRRRSTLLHAAAVYRPSPVRAGHTLYFAARDNTNMKRWEEVSRTPMTFERVNYDHADLGDPQAMADIADRLGALVPNLFTHSKGNR